MNDSQKQKLIHIAEIIALLIGTLVILYTLTALIYPQPVAEALIVDTYLPSPAPTPEPVEATPEPSAKPAESIYYHFDPSLFSTDERGRIIYKDENYTCMTGIDVSEHQYDIDWNAVAADGIEFAIIRIGYRGYTSGGLHEDAYYRANIEGALAAGIPVGVYFFSQATTVNEAKEEAEFVLDLIDGYDVSLPVVFDMEMLNWDYRTWNLSRKSLYRCTTAFCDTIADAGYEPMIYMTQFLGYQKYTLRELSKYGFWYAEYYVDYPSFVYDFDIWQYSDYGSVSGVSGNVDLDLYLIRNS